MKRQAPGPGAGQRSLHSFWQKAPAPTAGSAAAASPADPLSSQALATPAPASARGTKRRAETPAASQQPSQGARTGARDAWRPAQSQNQGLGFQRAAATPPPAPEFATPPAVQGHRPPPTETLNPEAAPDAAKRRRTFQRLLGDGEGRDAQAYRHASPTCL